jgi:glycosyltransferase involved in cell wall biosynthesis
MKLLILADANSIHTRRWAQALSEHGIHISIFTLVTVNFEHYKNHPAIKIHSININQNEFQKSDGNFSKLNYLKALPALKKLINELNPDIVHAYYASSYGLLGALTGFKIFYVSIWGSDVYLFPKKSFLHRKVFQYVLNHAHKIFSTSHAMKKEAHLYGLWPIEVIPFGVDTNIFKSTRLPFSDKTITIGCLKSLEDIYGIDILIDAFALLKKSNPDKKLKLQLIGSGPQKEKYLKQALNLNIFNDLEIIENAPRNTIPNLINQFDLACFPSRSESFGVAVLECMACERPVVASNIGGLPEIITDNQTGSIAANLTADGLQLAIQQFINNPALGLTMGQAARKSVIQNYQWHTNVASKLQSL